MNGSGLAKKSKISNDKLVGRIKALKSMCGLSTEQLARAIGCTTIVVYSWQKTKASVRPSLFVLSHLAKLENPIESEFPKIFKEWIEVAGYSLNNDSTKSQMETILMGLRPTDDISKVIVVLDNIIQCIVKEGVESRWILWELLFRISQSASKTETISLNEVLNGKIFTAVSSIPAEGLESLVLEDLHYLSKFPAIEKLKLETIKDLILAMREK